MFKQHWCAQDATLYLPSHASAIRSNRECEITHTTYSLYSKRGRPSSQVLSSSMQLQLGPLADHDQPALPTPSYERGPSVWTCFYLLYSFNTLSMALQPFVSIHVESKQTQVIVGQWCMNKNSLVYIFIATFGPTWKELCLNSCRLYILKEPSGRPNRFALVLKWHSQSQWPPNQKLKFQHRSSALCPLQCYTVFFA